MSPRTAATAGALLAAVAVALGAFGAHALEGSVSEARLATFETAVRYQMYHALGLLAAAALGREAARAGALLLAGSLVFSGALYWLVFTGQGWLGAVAPLGGTLQIVGWLLLARTLWRANWD